MNNNLFLLSVYVAGNVESFLACVDIDKSNLNDVIDKIKEIYGTEAVPIYFCNTNVKPGNMVDTLSYTYDFVSNAMKRYIFFDYMINDYRIIIFEETNHELIKSNIELKLVLLGNIKDMKERVIDNYINMYYPLAKINKIYANKDNVKSILDLIDNRLNTVIITDDLDLNTIIMLSKYMIKIRMIDNEYHLYSVDMLYNKLTIEPIVM